MNPKLLIYCIFLGHVLNVSALAQTGFDGPIPRFSEQASRWGIDHTYGNGSDFIVGGGAAVFDCNDDSLPDLFIAGGGNRAAFYVNQAGATFSNESQTLPLSPSALDRITGAYPFDYDMDGAVDLFIMRFGQNKLLKGLGDCQFSDATSSHLPRREDWTTSFAAKRATDGTHFDLWVIGNYVDRSQPLQADGNCTPSYFLSFPQPDKLGDMVPFTSSHCALSMLFVDLNGDGHLELRVANDREYYDADGAEQLFYATGHNYREAHAGHGWDRPTLWGMGLAHTILPDGRVGVSVTNMAENHFQVFSNTDDDHSSGVFAHSNQAFTRGLSSHRPYVGDDKRPSTAWHNQFVDINKDGIEDLLMIKGNVDSMPQFAQSDPDSLLLGRGDGTWSEVGDKAGIALPTRGRGAAIADFNVDGCQDILVVNRDEPVSLFINENCDHLPDAKSPARSLDAIGGGHAGGAWLPSQSLAR